jgi:V8-like Glu-specific endopeptidase
MISTTLKYVNGRFDRAEVGEMMTATPPAVTLWRSHIWIWRALALLVVAMTLLPQSTGAKIWPRLTPNSLSKLQHSVAVFGTDDRIPLPLRYRSVRDMMGIVFNPASRTLCSAFCVADNIIATAGHCLFRPGWERSPRLADVWFARGYDQTSEVAKIAGYANGSAAQNVTSGSQHLSVTPPIDATSDWALIRLARAACNKGSLPVRIMATEDIIREATAGRVFQISYHRDFMPWQLAYSKPCYVGRDFEPTDWRTIAADFINPDWLLLHTCDTGGASSGSPLLLDGPRGPEVIGINVGTYEQAKVLVENGRVTRRFKSNPVANTGVSAAAFASRLAALREANILSSGASMRELQTQLSQRRFYDGPVDGSYGPSIRRAIEAYEAASQLPVTGLATQATLRRLIQYRSDGGRLSAPRD